MELNEPVNGHENATTSLKVVLLVFAIVLIGALVYLVQVTYNEPAATETAPSVKDKTETAATAKSDCTEATTDQKAYESTNLGFCFTYPDAWILTDGKGAAEDKRVWYTSVTDKVIPDSDYPGQATVSIYSKVADRAETEATATTLKGYLDKAAGLSDPLFTDVKVATIGGKSGYSAKEGPGMFNPGSMHYFLELTDGKILEIQLHYSNANTTALLNSLKVTK